MRFLRWLKHLFSPPPRVAKIRTYFVTVQLIDEVMTWDLAHQLYSSGFSDALSIQSRGVPVIEVIRQGPSHAAVVARVAGQVKGAGSAMHSIAVLRCA